MKTVEFRPLRVVKKLDKIVVASYTQWRNVMTADYNKFNLVINDEYKKMPSREYVHNHKGELLYYFDYNPADVPIFDYSPVFDLDKIHRENKYYGILWSTGGHVNYHMPGADCDGVPSFTHWTEDRVTQKDCWNYYGGNSFAPLTVQTVTKWLGWFLWQLNNSYLKIGKSHP